MNTLFDNHAPNIAKPSQITFEYEIHGSLPMLVMRCCVCPRKSVIAGESITINSFLEKYNAFKIHEHIQTLEHD